MGRGKLLARMLREGWGVGGRMHRSDPAGVGWERRTKEAEPGMGRNSGQHKGPHGRTTMDHCVSHQETWGETCGIWGLEGGSIRKRALD